MRYMALAGITQQPTRLLQSQLIRAWLKCQPNSGFASFEFYNREIAYAVSDIFALDRCHLAISFTRMLARNRSTRMLEGAPSV